VSDLQFYEKKENLTFASLRLHNPPTDFRSLPIPEVRFKPKFPRLPQSFFFSQSSVFTPRHFLPDLSAYVLSPDKKPWQKRLTLQQTATPLLPISHSSNCTTNCNKILQQKKKKTKTKSDFTSVAQMMTFLRVSNNRSQQLPCYKANRTVSTLALDFTTLSQTIRKNSNKNKLCFHRPKGLSTILSRVSSS
jgi:hypothetical protein